MIISHRLTAIASCFIFVSHRLIIISLRFFFISLQLIIISLRISKFLTELLSFLPDFFSFRSDGCAFLSDLFAFRTEWFESRADGCAFRTGWFALLPAECRLIACFGGFGDFLQLSYTFLGALKRAEFLKIRFAIFCFFLTWSLHADGAGNQGKVFRKLAVKNCACGHAMAEKPYLFFNLSRKNYSGNSNLISLFGQHIWKNKVIRLHASATCLSTKVKKKFNPSI